MTKKEYIPNPDFDQEDPNIDPFKGRSPYAPLIFGVILIAAVLYGLYMITKYIRVF